MADRPVLSPAQIAAKFHRYTITSEGASKGYFRLVEDPEGAWVTFAEVREQAETIQTLQQEIVDWRKVEHEIGEAYMRIRTILDAFNTKPGGTDRYEVTEARARAAVEQNRQLSGTIQTLRAAFTSLRSALTVLGVSATTEALIAQCEAALAASAPQEKPNV